MPQDRYTCTIFYVAETRFFGFRYRFPDRKSHYELATFDTIQQVLAHCDAHHEHVWEDASDADENAILVSRDYKPGTVMWRMTHLTLAELQAHRDFDQHAA